MLCSNETVLCAAGSGNNYWVVFATTLFVCFVIFLILRFVATWYWKIDKRVQLQKEQNHLLANILYILQKQTGVEVPPVVKKERPHIGEDIGEDCRDIVVPEITSFKDEKVTYSDGSVAFLLFDDYRKLYYFLDITTRHYYESGELAQKAVYIYMKYQKISNQGLVKTPKV